MSKPLSRGRRRRRQSAVGLGAARSNATGGGGVGSRGGGIGVLGGVRAGGPSSAHEGAGGEGGRDCDGGTSPSRPGSPDWDSSGGRRRWSSATQWGGSPDCGALRPPPLRLDSCRERNGWGSAGTLSVTAARHSSGSGVLAAVAAAAAEAARGGDAGGGSGGWWDGTEEPPRPRQRRGGGGSPDEAGRRSFSMSSGRRRQGPERGAVFLSSVSAASTAARTWRTFSEMGDEGVDRDEIGDKGVDREVEEEVGGGMAGTASGGSALDMGARGSVSGIGEGRDEGGSCNDGAVRDAGEGVEGADVARARRSSHDDSRSGASWHTTPSTVEEPAGRIRLVRTRAGVMELRLPVGGLDGLLDAAPDLRGRVLAGEATEVDVPNEHEEEEERRDEEEDELELELARSSRQAYPASRAYRDEYDDGRIVGDRDGRYRRSGYSPARVGRAVTDRLARREAGALHILRRHARPPPRNGDANSSSAASFYPSDEDAGGGESGNGGGDGVGGRARRGGAPTGSSVHIPAGSWHAQPRPRRSISPGSVSRSRSRPRLAAARSGPHSPSNGHTGGGGGGGGGGRDADGDRREGRTGGGSGAGSGAGGSSVGGGGGGTSGTIARPQRCRRLRIDIWDEDGAGGGARREPNSAPSLSSPDGSSSGFGALPYIVSMGDTRMVPARRPPRGPSGTGGGGENQLSAAGRYPHAPRRRVGGRDPPPPRKVITRSRGRSRSRSDESYEGEGDTPHQREGGRHYPYDEYGANYGDRRRRGGGNGGGEPLSRRGYDREPFWNDREEADERVASRRPVVAAVSAAVRRRGRSAGGSSRGNGSAHGGDDAPQPRSGRRSHDKARYVHAGADDAFGGPLSAVEEEGSPSGNAPTQVTVDPRTTHELSSAAATAATPSAALVLQGKEPVSSSVPIVAPVPAVVVPAAPPSEAASDLSALSRAAGVNRVLEWQAALAAADVGVAEASAAAAAAEAAAATASAAAAAAAASVPPPVEVVGGWIGRRPMGTITGEPAADGMAAPPRPSIDGGSWSVAQAPMPLQAVEATSSVSHSASRGGDVGGGGGTGGDSGGGGGGGGDLVSASARLVPGNRLRSMRTKRSISSPELLQAAIALLPPASANDVGVHGPGGGGAGGGGDEVVDLGWGGGPPTRRSSHHTHTRHEEEAAEAAETPEPPGGPPSWVSGGMGGWDSRSINPTPTAGGRPPLTVRGIGGTGATVRLGDMRRGIRRRWRAFRSLFASGDGVDGADGAGGSGRGGGDGDGGTGGGSSLGGKHASGNLGAAAASVAAPIALLPSDVAVGSLAGLSGEYLHFRLVMPPALAMAELVAAATEQGFRVSRVAAETGRLRAVRPRGTTAGGGSMHMGVRVVSVAETAVVVVIKRSRADGRLTPWAEYVAVYEAAMRRLSRVRPGCVIAGGGRGAGAYTPV